MLRIALRTRGTLAPTSAAMDAISGLPLARQNEERDRGSIRLQRRGLAVLRILKCRQPERLVGVSTQGAEMEAKRVELLKELLPSLTRIAVLSNPINPYCVLAVRDAKRGAAALRIQLDVVNVSEPNDFDSAFAAIARARPGAAIVIADAILAGQRDQIAAFMLAQGLPSMYTYREYVDSGGLVSYSTSYFELFRREAVFIDKIFKGAKPGDIPIEQPTKFS